MVGIFFIFFCLFFFFFLVFFLFFFFFFFFQAEDGIRDRNVTGVQTCALPICPFGAAIASARAKFDGRLSATSGFQTANVPVQIKGVGFFDFIHGQTGVARSEERRVGKECRSRWSTDQRRKKKRESGEKK